MIVKEFYVKGIHCKNCKKNVELALESIEGIKKIKVDLESGLTIIKSKEEISENIIKEVIEEAGFEVEFDDE